MKRSIFSGKSTRTKVFSVITILGIALLVVLNVGFSFLLSSGAYYGDMTPEGFYTPSDKMIEVCHEILDPKPGEQTKEIKITFCTDPDYLTSSASLRATYFMTLKLARIFDNIEVNTVNVLVDPTAVAMYKTTSRDSISPYDMIISYGAKYRVVNASNFWTSDNFSYNGEYRLASILASLTAINSPAAYFITGHGETYYDPADPDSEMSKSTAYLAELLTERGLVIKTLELSSIDKIPDDCALLIINDPREDLKVDRDRLDEFGYISESEKIDRYLLSTSGAMIMNKSCDVTLPVLEDLAAEWGISFGNAQIFDEDNSLHAGLGESSDASVFTGVYDTDDQSYGYAYYGAYAALSSSPKMVFKNTGYVYCSFGDGEEMVENGNKYGSRNFASFIKSSENAYYKLGSEIDRGERSLIAAGVRVNLDDYTAERTSSYLFAVSSPDFFSNEILGNSSYANYDIMASVIDNISRTDRYVTIELGGLSVNSPSFGGKQTVDMTLSTTPTNIYSPDASEIIKVNKALTNGKITFYTCLAMAPAAIALGFGIAVAIKRKFM